MKRGTSLIVVILFGSGMAFGPAQASAKPCVQLSVAFPGNGCKVKPDGINTSVTSGFGKLRWSKWNRKRAVARGKLLTTHTYKARVVLTKPIRCGRGRRAFSYIYGTFKYGKKTEIWADYRIRGACRGA